MSTAPYTRRNFLGNMAILSAGAVLLPTGFFIPEDINAGAGLQYKWNAFCKSAGGRVFHDLPVSAMGNMVAKGHAYKDGNAVYFAKENIVAKPTWVYWNNKAMPADVVLVLFEGLSFKKITTLNRYEVEALYILSKTQGNEQLLSASFGWLKCAGSVQSATVQTRVHVKKNSEVQELSYYKKSVLIFEDTIIHHA